MPSDAIRNMRVMVVVGTLAVAVGAVCWTLPWLSAGGVASHCPWTYAIYWVVVFVWIGVAHKRWTATGFAPLATVLYLLGRRRDASLPARVGVARVGVRDVATGGTARPSSHDRHGVAPRCHRVARTTERLHRRCEPGCRARREAVARRRRRRPARRSFERGTGGHRWPGLVQSLEATQIKAGDAVAIVDMDHFKKVNDHYGHAVGDEVLIALASFLDRSLRDGDEVARYGGEEFIVVLRQAGDYAKPAIERLLDAWRVTEPVTTFSAGVAVHLPGSTPGGTLAAADAALYRAKGTGRDCVRDADGLDAFGISAVIA